MRIGLKGLLLAALIAAVPVTVMANSALRSIMHGWKTDFRHVHAMLTGRAAFDAPEITRTLEGFAADADRVANQIHGQGADARDIRQRFTQFQAQAQTALGDVTRPPMLAADLARLSQQCEACHDLYNN